MQKRQLRTLDTIKGQNIAKLQWFIGEVPDGPPFYRARLIFPRDHDHSRPKPRDFRGPTLHEVREARAAALKAHMDGKKTVKSPTFRVYLEEAYFPTLLREMDAGMEGRSHGYVTKKIARFWNYFLKPDKRCPTVKKLALRTECISKVTPAHMKEYFYELNLAGIGMDTRVLLRADWTALLEHVHDSLSKPPSEFFRFSKSKGAKVAIGHRAPKKTWDADFILEVLQNPKAPPMFRAACALLFDCLRRPSEIRALDWTDVNFKKSTVAFTKAQRAGRTGAMEIGQPKSGPGAAREEVPCYSFTMDALRAHYEAEKARGRDMNGPVFRTAERGARMTGSSWRDCWAEGKAALGLPDGPSFYSMKHAGNTWQALVMKVPVEIRQWKSGHMSDRMLKVNYNVVGQRDAVVSAAEVNQELARQQGGLEHVIVAKNTTQKTTRSLQNHSKYHSAER